MATIEPRLIHLLNNSQTPHLPPIDLPPLNATTTSSQAISLPPIDHENPATQIPPLYNTLGEENHPAPPGRIENNFTNDSAGRLTGSGRPLQLLLGEPEGSLSTLPLRMMLVDGSPEPSEETLTKKRPRGLTTNDDFVQLPQPLKKQKSSQQVVGVPPIINGLHEPPPDAAVFPPITADSFEDSEVSGTSLLNEFKSTPKRKAQVGGAAPTSDIETSYYGSRVKRRAAKPRRKWSDEETNHLLIGVSRHGVGKWTSILEDPDFKFNLRTAGDLKDRFRTCCPPELREQLAKALAAAGDQEQKTSDQNWKSKNGLDLENILIIDPEHPNERDPDASESGTKQRKSRAHRKKLEDLVELGIRGPFKKSRRRERRPFTEQDDKEILEGLDHYGPAWTKIQRDSKYHLSSRQPTDLRDRVRNKYPEVYAKIEKGSFQIKDPSQRAGGSSNLLEPSVKAAVTNTAFNSTMPASSLASLEPTLTRSSSKDDMSRWGSGSATWETTESPRALADPFDTGDTSNPFLSGTAPEMEIARLLLDDSQMGTTDHHARLTVNGQGYDSFSSRESPPCSGGEPSFTQMLNHP